MKLACFLSLLLISLNGFSQEHVATSDAFTIEGKVKHGATFTANAADSLPAVLLGDITTYNHRGEVRSVRKQVKGVLLRDALKDLLPDTDKPKELASYYFILVGTDGYRFVLSYSEVFGSENIYIVTETNGNKWGRIDDRIAVLYLMKPNNGHIAMKGLTRLIVQKAE